MLPLESVNVSYLMLDDAKRLKSHQTSVERSIAGLSYIDPSFTLSPLTILTPIGYVYAWDVESGRLDIEIPPTSQFYKGFCEFQTALCKQVSASTGVGVQSFYPMLHQTILSVYIHTNPQDEKKVGIYRNSEWSETFTKETLHKGQSIRLAIRFQGICFFKNSVTHEQKYRIQHHTRAIFV